MRHRTEDGGGIGKGKGTGRVSNQIGKTWMLRHGVISVSTMG